MQIANTTLYIPACHNNVEVVKYLLNLAGSETVELEAKNMVSNNMVLALLYVVSLQSVFAMGLQEMSDNYCLIIYGFLTKNGCNEAAGLLLSDGASTEAKANVCETLYISSVHVV